MYHFPAIAVAGMFALCIYAGQQIAKFEYERDEAQALAIRIDMAHTMLENNCRAAIQHLQAKRGDGI